MSSYNSEIDDAGYLKQQWLLQQLQFPNLTVFDIGANVGQSIAKYRGIAPECTVHSFEPHPETFAKLERHCAGLSGVQCDRVALGAEPGTARFHATNCPEASSLLPPEHFVQARSAKKNYDYRIFEVCVDTLDNVAREKQVERIHVLKIDVQGAELGVLQGARELLAQQRIDIIYSEVLFAENYVGQCDFNEIWNYLRPFGYHLWDLFPFLHTHQGRLWTGNAVFVSAEIMKRIDPRDK